MPDAAESVGIILLNHNGWRDTVACLESLQGLDGQPPHEILVVDNASSDDSVQRLESAFSELAVVPNEANLGFAGGCNVGLNWARRQGHTYAWLLNNDTVVESNTLAAMVDLARQNPRVAAVGSVARDWNQPQSVQSWGGASVSLLTGHVRNQSKPSPRLTFISGVSMLLRLSALDEVGLFDERFFFQWEDVDLCLRLRKAGWELAVAEGSQLRHKGGATSGGTNPVRMEHYARGLVLALRKHARFPWLSTWPIWGYFAFLMVSKRASWAAIQSAARGWWHGWRM